MSEIDFEFEVIDSSQVEVSRRSKKKYSHKLWEYETDKEKTRYELAVLRMHQRRNSPYVEELIDKIDKRYAYEIQMESVFHADSESDVDVDDVVEIALDDDVELDVNIKEKLDTIVNIKYMNDFRVLTGFEFDSKNNRIFARVPAGVVNKKMSLQDIYDEYEKFCSSSTFINMKDKKRKAILMKWIVNAGKILKQDIAFALSVYTDTYQNAQILEID